MLTYFKNSINTPIANYTTLTQVFNQDGTINLTFDLTPADDEFKALAEGIKITHDNNLYVIDKINRRSQKSTILCSLDFSGLKKQMFKNYDATYKSFAEICNEILPIEWSVIDVGNAKGRRAIHAIGVTAYDILIQCQGLFNVVYEYNTLAKTIRVIDTSTMQARGLYLVEDLNLKALEYKGDFTDKCTRLYAQGAPLVDEAGEVTGYVTFADINDGKDYIDNFDYTSDIICKFWADERFDDKQALLDEAIEKLKIMSCPNKAYSCKIIDIAKCNDEYKMLELNLHDKITLLDNGNKIIHSIVQYTKYPNEPSNNIVVLSSEFKQLKGSIETIKNNITAIDTTLKNNNTSINELVRDVDRNTLRIKDTYTKGQTDTMAESIITQTQESIDLSVGEVNKNLNQLSEDVSFIEIRNDEITQKVESINNDIATLDSSLKAVETKQSDTAFSIDVINQQLENGVEKVKTTTGFTFDANGLNISNSESEISNLLDNTGMFVTRGNERLLTVDTEGVIAKNLTSDLYLVVGDNSRHEDYYDSEEDKNGTGVFYIGGGN